MRSSSQEERGKLLSEIELGYTVLYYRVCWSDTCVYMLYGCGCQRVVARLPLDVHHSVSDVNMDSPETLQAVKPVRATSRAG